MVGAQGVNEDQGMQGATELVELLVLCHLWDQILIRGMQWFLGTNNMGFRLLSVMHIAGESPPFDANPNNGDGVGPLPTREQPTGEGNPARRVDWSLLLGSGLQPQSQVNPLRQCLCMCIGTPHCGGNPDTTQCPHTLQMKRREQSTKLPITKPAATCIAYFCRTQTPNPDPGHSDLSGCDGLHNISSFGPEPHVEGAVQDISVSGKEKEAHT